LHTLVYAEDPDAGFLPSPGLVRGLRAASGPGIRNDGGVTAGYTVPIFYDSMIAKLIAWAETRAEAIARMTRALSEYEVLGVKTTIPFFIWLMRDPDFASGRFETTYLDRLLGARRGESFSALSQQEEMRLAIAAAVDAWLRTSQALPGNGAAEGPVGAWKRAARQDALRS